ncbi:MAG: AraC family transcriptional regulator [Pseudomonadales bacterium]|nr:AraC family transcriptional regulator [Pseudomonadales bacterium]MCP5215776.1 AraC family transcriptional regulator [Pseudomonadales bacterium]
MQQFPSQHPQQFLPDQYLWFRSRNLDEARDTISNAYDSHQLDTIGARRKVDISLHVAALNSVSFSLVQYSSDVVATVEEGSGVYVLMPLTGQLEVNSGGQRIFCEPGYAVIQNSGVGFQKVMRNNYRQLVVKFNPNVLMQHLEEYRGIKATAPIHFDTTLDIHSSKGASWWRTVNYVMEELRNADMDGPQQLINEPLERLLIQNILRCQTHNYSDALEAPRSYQLAPWYVKRVEEYLQASLSESVTLNELAKLTGVSPRSLQYGFKRAHGITPMQYLKDLRLEQVRTKLVRGDIHTSVTTAAMACGFKQLGWFANQYKEKYGETPSETLRRGTSERVFL